jgi:hypothetical protein|tara:strand:- start:9746 stop:10060 length:315 start_codon:yes stop_codon:yes gene_type:complete
MPSEAYDTGNPKQITKKKTKAAIAKERRDAALKQILSGREGRGFVWRTLEKCGVYKTSFTGNSTTFFNEGRRSVGLEILEEILSADAGAYATMRQEAAQDKEKT